MQLGTFQHRNGKNNKIKEISLMCHAGKFILHENDYPFFLKRNERRAELYNNIPPFPPK